MLQRLKSTREMLQSEIQAIEQYCGKYGNYCTSSYLQTFCSSVSSSNVVSSLVTTVEYVNGRMYRDGTFAESCKEYRYPSNSTFYAYSNEGSGYYQIKSSVRVYCDMDTDGGGWTVIGNWINQNAQYFGIGDLGINFWGPNYIPKHTQVMSFTANSVLRYAWVYNQSLPSYPFAGDVAIGKPIKALYNATNINICSQSMENYIGVASTTKVLLTICESVFGIPVNTACGGSPNPSAIHIGSVENFGSDVRYAPPNCAYRCGTGVNVGQFYRVLVR